MLNRKVFVEAYKLLVEWNKHFYYSLFQINKKIKMNLRNGRNLME